MSKKTKKYTELIKQKAEKFGFQACGISRAGFLEEEVSGFEKWLKAGYNGEMHYMENHFDKRLDPRLLVEGAKSVISLSYNYYPEHQVEREDNFKISKYAYGENYHEVIKDLLRELVAELQEEIGEFGFRVFIDSAPVMERAWVRRSGIVWFGKNGNMISKKYGSFFFLSEIIFNLELEEDGVATDHCGNCTRCIDACPTQAILGI